MPVNYNQYVPQAYKRYMENIFGRGGEKDFIAGQVGGVSAGMQPFLQQASKQTAGNLGGRGGLGGGSQDAALSDLLGKKVSALRQAGSAAQKNITGTKTHALGLAQREAFKLSDDQMRQLMFDLQKKQMWMQLVGDIVGAGGTAAGMAYNPVGTAAGMMSPQDNWNR